MRENEGQCGEVRRTSVIREGPSAMRRRDPFGCKAEPRKQFILSAQPPAIHISYPFAQPAAVGAAGPKPGSLEELLANWSPRRLASLVA